MKRNKKQKLNSSEVLTDENIEKLIKRFKVNNFDEILLSIGSLRYTGKYIINLSMEITRSS